MTPSEQIANLPTRQLSAILDALPVHIAVLDGDGNILAVNEAWRRFADANDMACDQYGVGDNYLTVCERAEGDWSAQAGPAANGIRAVLSGKADTFELEYPCHSPTEQRWFQMMAVALPDDGPARAVVRHINITDRREAEYSLVNATSRNQIVLDTVGEGIHGIDASGNIIYENTAALTMLGYTDGELLGRHSHSTIHHHKEDGSVYPKEDCPIYKTLSDGQTRRVWDEMFFRKDGSGFPVSYTCTAIKDDRQNKITGAVVSFRDISDRKREERLRKAESEVLEMISGGDALIEIFNKIVLTIDSLIPDVYVSILLPEEDGKVLRHAAAHRLPYTFVRAVDGVAVGPASGCSGTAAYRKSLVVVADIDNDPLCSPFRDVAREHGILSCWAIPVLSGKADVLATFAMYSKKRRTPQAWELNLITKVSKLVGIAFERQQYIAELKDKEERFRIIAQATTDVVWDWNLVKNRIWWSEGVRSMYGYDIDNQPVGPESWTDHIHPDDRQRVVDGIYAVINGSGMEWIDEYRYLKADGSLAQVSDRGFVIRNDRGKAIRMVGSMIDLTKQRQLEEQLRQAQRLDAVGQLTGGIAHDFNNLLTVILGNAEAMLDNLPSDHRLRKLAQLTKTAAERGAELTSRLLAFARRQPLDPKAVNVNQLLVSLDELLRRTLGEHIEIKLLFRDDLCMAMADQPQLESALLNLCINARDAMPNGGNLTVETANVELDAEMAAEMEIAAGKYVMLAVSDVGIGMTPGVQKQAFEPFYTTKEVGKGSGLGLSMVYGFAKQSKGHVRIYSEVGQGTTVKLYLPSAPDDAQQTEPYDSTDKVSGGTQKILVVEDDELVRSNVTMQLASLGYQVISASNGAEALQVLEKQQDFDLLFTDVVMPGGMSGRDLADEVRKRQPHLPILFTSGYTENAMIHHGRLDPGVQLLQKPYRRRELADKIRQVLASV